MFWVKIECFEFMAGDAHESVARGQVNEKELRNAGFDS